jgi:hypothetical protein
VAAVAQAVPPTEQPQAPSRQVNPAAQGTPQAPQFSSSVSKLTHRSPQRCWLTVQRHVRRTQFLLQQVPSRRHAVP